MYTGVSWIVIKSNVSLETLRSVKHFFRMAFNIIAHLK